MSTRSPLRRPAPRPCESCPYRSDVPAGIWAPEEYDKLPRYDEPTYAQPAQVFLCHQRDGRVCAGWAGCHDGNQLLALRLAGINGSMMPDDIAATVEYRSPAPIFDSGAAAAAHGQSGIDRPDERARRAIGKLTWRRGSPS